MRAANGDTVTEPRAIGPLAAWPDLLPELRLMFDKTKAASPLRAALAAMPKRMNPPSHFTLDRLPLPEGVPIHETGLNECPAPPPPSVLRAIADAAAIGNRYPDPMCTRLGALIAETSDFPADRIVFSAGSEELIFAAARMVLDPGDRCVFPTPSFPVYQHATATVGGRWGAATLDPGGACDADALLAAIDETTKLVFCTTVNNPTGGLIAEADLARLARETPPSVLLAIDDAYCEYARHAGGYDALDVLRQRPGPWILMRTFSKAYALAGLRVGYAFMSDPELADAYGNLKATFNVTSVAQAAAAAAWRETGWRDNMLALCATQRSRLVDGFEALGCRPFPTVANYVTARIGRPAGPVAGTILSQGVIAGALHDPGFEDCLRISTGTEADTDAFLAALAKAMAA